MEGIYVSLWLIRADLWQKPIQYCHYPSITNKENNNQPEFMLMPEARWGARFGGATFCSPTAPAGSQCCSRHRECSNRGGGNQENLRLSSGSLNARDTGKRQQK